MSNEFYRIKYICCRQSPAGGILASRRAAELAQCSRGPSSFMDAQLECGQKSSWPILGPCKSDRQLRSPRGQLQRICCIQPPKKPLQWSSSFSRSHIWIQDSCWVCRWILLVSALGCQLNSASSSNILYRNPLQAISCMWHLPSIRNYINKVIIWSSLQIF